MDRSDEHLLLHGIDCSQYEQHDAGNTHTVYCFNITTHGSRLAVGLVAISIAADDGIERFR